MAVAASQPTQSVTFALERSRSATPVPATPSSLGRRSATLTVESRPLGATVTIDGKPAGRTPLTLSDISEGIHTVSIELAGYNSVTTSVRVAAT